MRRTAFTLLAAAAVGLFVASANAQELLDDGNFDNPTTQTDISNSDWVLVANSPDTIDLSTRFQASGFARSGGAAGSGAGVWYRSFEGNQGGSGEDPAESSLTQSVTAPLDSDYLLTFEAAREVSFTADEWFVSLTSDGAGGSASVDLLAAVIPAGNFNQVQVANGGPGPATFSLLLSGVDAGDTLTVLAQMSGGVDVGGSQSAFLDSFSLTAIPEPTSLLLASLAAVGLAARRRRG